MPLLIFALSSAAIADGCPWHCSTWFDGCGNCACVNGQVQDCDKNGCPDTPQRPRCLVPADAAADKPESCKWFGTAPFCKGSCPVGYHQKQRSVRGDGKKCATGSKAYCCPVLRVANPPAYCLTYAQRAVDQYQRAIARGCRVSGPVWDPNLDHHFDWCLLQATRDLAQRGDKNREIFISEGCRN